jgi:hypothetical protein
VTRWNGRLRISLGDTSLSTMQLERMGGLFDDVDLNRTLGLLTVELRDVYPYASITGLCGPPTSATSYVVMRAQQYLNECGVDTSTMRVVRLALWSELQTKEGWYKG